MADLHPLKAYRAANSLSVEDLAKRLGVSRVTVFRWETGRREIDRKLWATIAQRTGLPISVVAGLPTPASAAQEAAA